jgi:hypothetical protein
MAKLRFYIGPITGIMLGFELSENEEYSFLILDLVFVEVILEWDK